jgi:uncharacterized lipoprotein YddW (UPF0748 family)
MPQLPRPAAVLAATLLALPLPALPLPAAAAGEHAPPRLALWMEPGANLTLLSTADGVRKALDQAKQAGVDVVIPEAKNAWGYATYPSAFVPSIATSPIAHTAPPAYPPPAQWYPQGYDMLGTIVQEAHARGLRVHVAVNSFGEGFAPARAGPGFDHPDWQATAYLATRPVLGPDGTSYDLSGADVPRDENMLVLYTPASGAATPTSRWGVEVAVAGDRVTEIRDRRAGDSDPGPTPIPRHGYVLSGHGDAAQWLLKTFTVGAAVGIGPVKTRMAPSSSHSIFAFVNPTNPDVDAYEMGVIYEVLTRYDVDGLILDRTRYQDLSEDFSPLSRLRFERFLGRPVAHWPDDIYRYAPSGYWIRRVPGPLYRQWLGYRATTIRTYTGAAARLVRTLRPRVALGMYVGAWYPVYYDEGVNWASPSVWPPYPWIGDAWVRAGLAPLLDYLMIGLYYRPVTVGEARATHHDDEISIQGGALLADRLVHGDTPLVGSLLVSLYQGDPARMTRAVEMSRRVTSGTMLFDLVYLTQDGLWPAIPPAETTRTGTREGPG